MGVRHLGTGVLTVVLSGLFGLVIGSFLNVVVYRVPRGLSIVSPPSHCPSCRMSSWPLYDNISLVVSWIVLRGKCRNCGRQNLPPLPPGRARHRSVVFACDRPGLSLAPFASPHCSWWWQRGSSSAVAIDLDGLANPPVAVLGAMAFGAVTLVAVSSVASAMPDGSGGPPLGGGARRGLLGPGHRGQPARLLPRPTTPDWTGSWSVARWPRVALLVGTLGWIPGGLWPVAGPVLAGWALVTIGIGAVVGSDRRPGTPGLVVVALGGLGTGAGRAALGGP